MLYLSSLFDVSRFFFRSASSFSLTQLNRFYFRNKAFGVSPSILHSNNQKMKQRIESQLQQFSENDIRKAHIAIRFRMVCGYCRSNKTFVVVVGFCWLTREKQPVNFLLSLATRLFKLHALKFWIMFRHGTSNHSPQNWIGNRITLAMALS